MLKHVIIFIFAVTFVCKVNLVAMATAQIKQVDFEVFGKVQGVFFRKHTRAEAEKLNIRGWCQNTLEGTVRGHLEGPSDKIETMMQWLRTKGSPRSVIERVAFTNQKEIPAYNYQDFKIHQDG